MTALNREQLIEVKITRREFMKLPMETRRRILKEQAEGLDPFEPKAGTLCKSCTAYKDCEMQDAAQYCGGYRELKQ